MAATPRSIPEYLHALREALRGADPALIQDALYDAEEYLRAELAARPGSDEASVLAEMAGSYGAPEEVAAIYTDREQQVEAALRPRPPLPPASAAAAGRAPGMPLPAAARAVNRGFFGVALDPRTYGALFYMLLALPLGIFYFAWVVTGVALSAGLAILIIGVPFTVAFLATVYALSLVEGRLVEALLGERMPRRPTPAPAAAPLLVRVRMLLAEPRTWSTLLYMFLMLPLGILYFTLVTVLLTVSLGLSLGSAFQLLQWIGLTDFDVVYGLPEWTAPLLLLAGVALFFASLHIARGLGRMHAGLAKSLLVERAD